MRSPQAEQRARCADGGLEVGLSVVVESHVCNVSQLEKPDYSQLNSR